MAHSDVEMEIPQSEFKPPRYVFSYSDFRIRCLNSVLTYQVGDLKAPFSIDTTPKYREERYFFHWIA